MNLTTGVGFSGVPMGRCLFPLGIMSMSTRPTTANLDTGGLSYERSSTKDLRLRTTTEQLGQK